MAFLWMKDTKDHLNHALADARITVSTLQYANTQLHHIETAIRHIETASTKSPPDMAKQKARELSIILSRTRRHAELLRNSIVNLERRLK